MAPRILSSAIAFIAVLTIYAPTQLNLDRHPYWTASLPAASGAAVLRIAANAEPEPLGAAIMILGLTGLMATRRGRR